MGTLAGATPWQVAGHALQRRLRETDATGVVPDDAWVAVATERWLPADLVRCRRRIEPSGCAVPCFERVETREHGHRCSAAYWREHSSSVASLMEAVAASLGDDVLAYRAAGLLHDLDFLSCPHDVHDPGADSHPLPLAEELAHKGVRSDVVLAVLEHAPRMRLEPSSAMSHALILCDDVDTFASAGVPFPFPAEDTVLRGHRPQKECSIDDATTASPGRADRALASYRALERSMRGAVR